MALFSINVNEKIDVPSVGDNQGNLNMQSRVFSSSDFTKDFTDPQGGQPSVVTIETIPVALELQYNAIPATSGVNFQHTNSGLLQFNLHPKYSIHNGVLYEFAKDIDLIIADYKALGLELIANVQGLLTFIDPLNLADIRFVQGVALDKSVLQFNFTTQSSITNYKSNVATFSLIPWENVNLKTNYILQSGSQGANPVTGLAVTGDVTKTITITFNDATTITADFIDNDTTTNIVVTDANTNPTRHKVATVDGTDLFETVTALITPTLVGNTLTLSYKNENGVTQQVQIDLSGLTPTNDIHLSGNPTYDAGTNVITLTETNGSVFTIDLSEFSIGITTNGDGTVDIIQEGVTKITISKVGITGEYGDLKNITDQKLTVIKIPASELNGVDLTDMAAVTTEVKNWMNTHSTPITDKQFIAIEIENDIVTGFSYTFPYNLA